MESTDMPPWWVIMHLIQSNSSELNKQKQAGPCLGFEERKGGFLKRFLTLRRTRGADSGVLGDVDSLAVSDVELSEELLLDNSLLEGRLVAN